MLKLNALLPLLLIAGNLYASEYNTTKILVELNDPKAARNPVRSVRGDNWKAADTRARIKHRTGQDVAIVCEGKFPIGMIADDLIRSEGQFNSKFTVTPQTTLLDICHQQEDMMRAQNPKMFK